MYSPPAMWLPVERGLCGRRAQHICCSFGECNWLPPCACALYVCVCAFVDFICSAAHACFALFIFTTICLWIVGTTKTTILMRIEWAFEWPRQQRRTMHNKTSARIEAWRQWKVVGDAFERMSPCMSMYMRLHATLKRLIVTAALREILMNINGYDHGYSETIYPNGSVGSWFIWHN